MIRLATPAGGEIVLAMVGAGECAHCQTSVDAGARLICALAAGPGLDVPMLCGGCISKAFAYLFGVAHVADGGRASDLADHGLCPHCRRREGVEVTSSVPPRRYVCSLCEARWTGRRE